jgi:hypothetical protein
MNVWGLQICLLYYGKDSFSQGGLNKKTQSFSGLSYDRSLFNRDDQLPENNASLLEKDKRKYLSRQASWLLVLTIHSCGTALDLHQLPPFKPWHPGNRVTLKNKFIRFYGQQL